MKKFLAVTVLIMLALHVNQARAHCQIPCGIYGDELRIFQLREDVTTIEKSMQQIEKLSAETPVNYNQLVRWVNNKEEHAQKIQDIVTAYFLTQRIKPVAAEDKDAYAAYSEKVVVLQQMLVQAMKTKQTTDVKHCDNLRRLTDRFAGLYFDAEALKHLQEHDK